MSKAPISVKIEAKDEASEKLEGAAPKIEKVKKLTPKQEQKVADAVALFTKVVQYRIILQNCNKVASEPLPKKKKIAMQRVVVDRLNKLQAKQSELDDFIKKFTSSQQAAYVTRCKELVI